MTLVDANILIYAYHPQSPFHGRAKTWLETAFTGTEQVGLPWSTLLAFLRITTSPKVFERPLGIEEATVAVASWLELPTVTSIAPGERYWSILQALLAESRATGALVSDAALAALAIEHGSTLATTDRDFRRFAGLKLLNPLGD